MTLPLVKEVIALMAAPPRALALGGCKGRWFTMYAGAAPYRGKGWRATRDNHRLLLVKNN